MCILKTREIQRNGYFPSYDYIIPQITLTFRVTMKLLMAQLHKTDFLKASSVKVIDIMPMSANIS